MFSIFMIPIIGLLLDLLLNKLFPKAMFRGYDILPFFFIPACGMITHHQNNPSFLPYGFLFFFILVIIMTVELAIKNKNISLGNTLRQIWRYLSISSVIWYFGLLFLMII